MNCRACIFLLLLLLAPFAAAQPEGASAEKERGAATPAVTPDQLPWCGPEGSDSEDYIYLTTDEGEEMMIMPGTPKWLYWFGITFVLVGSFLVLGSKSAREAKGLPGRRLDLMRIRPLHWLLKRPWIQFAFQFPVFLIFAFLIYAGLFGNEIINITPLMTWTIWWAGLVMLVVFLGKAWCFVCPWDFVASLLQRMRLWGVNRRPLTLGLPWPKWLSNIYLAIGLFLVLTWLELGFRITASPTYTAYFALGMVAFSVLPALIFEKRGFCRHGCLVGRISGLYATFSPIEIRARNPRVCGECDSRACLNGNDKGYPCPTGILLPALRENTYCIMCTECVRSCPHDNVAVNLRPFAEDLRTYRKARRDEALLAIIMLAMSAFHGLTMTPLWEDYRPENWSVVRWISQGLGVDRLWGFTVGMTAGILLPILVFWFTCYLTRAFVRARDVSVGKVFVNFAYAILPVALFYHLAHNSMHLFMEGQTVAQLASNPLGEVGVNYFGTIATSYPSILNDMEIWILQTVLIVVGHIFGFYIAGIAAKKVFATPRQAMLAHIPMGLLMVLSTYASLWLIHMDMNMRMSMM